MGEKKKSDMILDEKRKMNEKLNAKYKEMSESVLTLKKEKANQDKKSADIHTEYQTMEKILNDNYNNKAFIEEKNLELDMLIKEKKDARKYKNDQIKKTKKLINQEHKEQLKYLHEDTEVVTEKAEIKDKKVKEKKDHDQLVKEQRLLNEQKKNLGDENMILAGIYIKKELEDKKMQAEIIGLKHTNSIFEGQENAWHQQLIKLTEEIKFLSTIREKMARTAS